MNASRLFLLLGLAACAGCIPTGSSSGDGQKSAGATETPKAGDGTATAVRPSDASAAPSPKTAKAGAPNSPAPGGGKPAAQPGATAPVAGDDDDAVAKEMKALCGTWEYYTRGAEKEGLCKLRLNPDGTYLDDTIGGPVSGTFTIDPTKRPRTIDFNDGGTTTLCIYEIKGKELTIASDSEDGEKRPRGFSGKNVSVQKYK